MVFVNEYRQRREGVREMEPIKIRIDTTEIDTALKKLKKLKKIKKKVMPKKRHHEGVRG